MASFSFYSAAAAVLLSAAGCGMRVEPDRVRPIDPPEAQSLLDAWTNAFVLDVSPPDDYDAAHLPRAVNIPRSQLWYRMYDVPDDQGTFILVYDADGSRALDAALQLRNEGYFRVYALRGGLKAWRAAKLPVLSGPALGPTPGGG